MASWVVVAVTPRFIHVYGKGWSSTPYQSRSGAAALAKKISDDLTSEGRRSEVRIAVKRVM